MLGKQKIICGRLSISQIRLFFCSYYANLKKQAIGACTRLLLNCGTGSFCWKKKLGFTRLWTFESNQLLWKQKIMCGVLSISHIRLLFFSYYANFLKNKLKEPVLDCCFIVFFFLAFGNFFFSPQNSRFFFSRSFDDFNCGSNFAFGESILVFRWNPSHNLLFFSLKNSSTLE